QQHHRCIEQLSVSRNDRKRVIETLGGWHFKKNGVSSPYTHRMATTEPLRTRGAAPRYELLTLGDELLLGLTANGHLTWIGAELGRRGVLLGRNVTITDEASAIAEQFRESWAKADVI